MWLAVVGLEAGKKASLLIRGKSNLNFSVSIKPAVWWQNVDLSHQQKEGEVSRLDQICISIVTGIENGIIYSTRDDFLLQMRYLEIVTVPQWMILSTQNSIGEAFRSESLSL